VLVQLAKLCSDDSIRFFWSSAIPRRFRPSKLGEALEEFLHLQPDSPRLGALTGAPDDLPTGEWLRQYPARTRGSSELGPLSWPGWGMRSWELHQRRAPTAGKPVAATPASGPLSKRSAPKPRRGLERLELLPERRPNATGCAGAQTGRALDPRRGDPAVLWAGPRGF